MPGKLRDRATTFMKTPKANSDIVFGAKCNLAGGENRPETKFNFFQKSRRGEI